MLNIQILREQDSVVNVLVSIPKRANVNEKIYIYQADHILKKATEEILKKDNSIISCELISEIRRLKNKLESHKTEQILKFKIHRKVEKEAKSKPKAKRKPRAKKKATKEK